MDRVIKAELKKFIDLYGSQKKAADALGMVEGSIAHYIHGRRKVGPDVALRMEKASQGQVDKFKLVFGRAA